MQIPNWLCRKLVHIDGTPRPAVASICLPSIPTVPLLRSQSIFFYFFFRCCLVCVCFSWKKRVSSRGCLRETTKILSFNYSQTQLCSTRLTFIGYFFVIPAATAAAAPPCRWCVRAGVRRAGGISPVI